jgi:hypothetical protein
MVDNKPAPADQDGKTLILAAILTAVLRAKLAAAERQTVGVALSGDLITLDGAIEWLTATGMIDEVIT